MTTTSKREDDTVTSPTRKSNTSSKRKWHGICLESREALEIIQDARNQDEAILLADIHGLILSRIGESRTWNIMHHHGGWVVQLMPESIEYIPAIRTDSNVGAFPTVKYRSIKRLLRKP